MDGANLPGVVETPVPWRRPAAVAPAVALVRDGDDTLIRYRYAGEEWMIWMPFPVWESLVQAARNGAFDALRRVATPWGAGTGRIHRASPDVIIGYVHDGRDRVHQVPAAIWDQLIAAVRIRATDDLDAISRRGPTN